MKNNILVKALMTLFVPVVFLACKSAPKGEISSSANPREEIRLLTFNLKAAQESNVDILAKSEFEKSQKYLDKATTDLANGKDQETVLDDLRFGKESLKNAENQAESRKDVAPGLLEARQKAILAGATKTPALKNEWIQTDEDAAKMTIHMDKASSKEIAELQTRYMELEKKAIFEKQLGVSKSQIIGARENKASKYAPQALKKSEISMKNAESLIGSNINNPAGFQPAVLIAKNDASILVEVIDMIKQNGWALSEASALKIVSQKHKISDLTKDLSTSEEQVAGVETKLNANTKSLVEKDKKLKEKDLALSEAQETISIQSAIKKSQLQFTPNEAEAFQQGDNLLIRLKAMNFESGRSELPTSSLTLLSKVSEVAKSLNAKEIKIDGHTDSVGTSGLNKKLSEQRASAVATYFKTNGFEEAKVQSEGHGFEHPIATNKSKAGRAQNRRVDIIITPTGAAKIIE